MSNGQETGALSALRPLIKSQQYAPVTVSAPAIHYTTDIDATAEAHPDSFFFIAYNQSYRKRILHVLTLKDGLSLFTPRPLIVEASFQSNSTISVAQLVKEKFADEPASLFILVPPPPFYVTSREQSEIDRFEGELRQIGEGLPHLTLNIGSGRLPPMPPGSPARPRMLQVSGRFADQKIVVLDQGRGIPVNRDDVFL